MALGGAGSASVILMGGSVRLVVSSLVVYSKLSNVTGLETATLTPRAYFFVRDASVKFEDHSTKGLAMVRVVWNAQVRSVSRLVICHVGYKEEEEGPRDVQLQGYVHLLSIQSQPYRNNSSMSRRRPPYFTRHK